MIICSKTGARPNKDALESFMKLPKKGAVYVVDKKYHTLPNPTSEQLETIFENKHPYCLCVSAEKNERKFKGCFNPFICCKSSDGMWAVWSEMKLITIDKFSTDKESPDVEYSDLAWKKNMLKLTYGGKNTAQNKTMNIHQRESLMIFTSSYECAYATWNNETKRWRKNYYGGIARPYPYEHCLYIGKNGGFKIDEESLDIKWDLYENGGIKNKVVGRIEKYMNEYIKEMKGYVVKNPTYDYYDKSYYETEMQAVWLVVQAVKLLKSHVKKLTEKNLETLLYNIKVPETFYGSLYPKDRLENYFLQHIDYIFNDLLS